MATRRAPPYEFDHGTQFFTARSQAFRDEVQRWRRLGVVDAWRARCVELDRGRLVAAEDWDETYAHYVAVPGMNQLGKHLANGIDVRFQACVDKLVRRDRQWCLLDPDGAELGTFDWVVSTAPAAQTAALLPESFSHHRSVSDRKMLACFALLLGFERPVALEWQAAVVHNADVSWIAVNSSKPGRPQPFTLVVHSSNSFAETHIESTLDDVLSHLAGELLDVTGIEAAGAGFRTLHRWRYANIDRQAGEPALIDVERGLAACGDWCIRGRVEAGFTSAMTLAESLLGAI